MAHNLLELAHLMQAELLQAREIGANFTFASPQFDSRFVNKDDIFFAIKGLEADGHDYLEKAANKGALAVFVTYWPADLNLATFPAYVFKVDNTRKALAISANYFYDEPSANLQLVGITASNGKTSTSLMYKSIVKAAGFNCGLIGTVSYETAKREEMSHLTTPDAVKLQSLLAEMRDNNYEEAVMECSSIGLDQYRNYAVKYKAVAFNNISREHLDYHGSFVAYLEAKLKLITECADSKTKVILDFDDAAIYAKRELAKGPIIGFADAKNWPDSKLNSLAAKDCPQVLAAQIDLSKGTANFNLVVKREILGQADNAAEAFVVKPVKLQVPGYHSVMNALSAASLALAVGFSLDEIVRGLEAYTGIERRFQRILAPGTIPANSPWQKYIDYQIYDDHFANPGNICFSLNSLCQMDYRKLHIVYAIRGKRGVTVNSENIYTLKDYLPKLRLANFIATTSKDVVGHYDTVTDEELAAFQAAMHDIGQDYTLYPELTQALEVALTKVEANDVILLAGCQGMDAGARLCLEAICAKHAELDATVIMAVVKDRICGQADEATNKDKLFAGASKA